MTQDETRPLLDAQETTDRTESVQGQDGDGVLTHLPLIAPMAIAMFLGTMDSTVVLASYAAIGSDLHELHKASLISAAYLITATSVKLLYGKFSDIFGRKSCLLFSYGTFALGSLLCGVSRNMNELIASRALAGMGGGGISIVVNIIISDIVPLRSRGKWQGILNMVQTVGTASGASLGGLFADTIGWRWSFLLQVPIALFSILAVAVSLHLPPRNVTSEDESIFQKLARVDLVGSLTLIVTIFLLIVGLERGSNVGWSDSYTRSAMLGFALSVSLLTFIEFKWAKEPFAPQKVVLNRSLFANYAANFLGMGAAFIFIFHVPLWIQAVLRKTASETSGALIGSGICQMLASLTSGLVIEGAGRYYWLTVLMYGLLVAGSIGATLGAGVDVTSELTVTMGFMILSLGLGGGISTTFVALIASAGAEDQGMATGVSFLFRSLGSVVGLSLGSTVVQLTLKTALRSRLEEGGRDVDEIVRRVRESLLYLDQLDETTQAVVRASYGSAIQMAFVLACGMAVGALASAALIVEKSLLKR